jgi:nitrilase
MKVVAIQVNSGPDKKENLEKIVYLVTKACNEVQPDLVALPEMFTGMGVSLEERKKSAENIEHPTRDSGLTTLKTLAKKFKMTIHGGSFCEEKEDQYYNTTCVVNEHGNVIVVYRKINLFQFQTLTNVQYDESALLTAGDSIVTYPLQNHAIGCTICFDLRFGDIFQKLIRKKVDVIVIPSAFTYETGKAHWEILCRARAIETQSFVIAPAQTGSHYENGVKRDCWGHSMIVDPWGNILASMVEEEGYIAATLDFEFLEKTRNKLPTVKTINA